MACGTFIFRCLSHPAIEVIDWDSQKAILCYLTKWLWGNSIFNVCCFMLNYYLHPCCSMSLPVQLDSTKSHSHDPDKIRDSIQKANISSAKTLHNTFPSNPGISLFGLFTDTELCKLTCLHRRLLFTDTKRFLVITDNTSSQRLGFPHWTRVWLVYSSVPNEPHSLPL